MKALVVCHHRIEDLGTLEPILHARGFDIDYVLGHEDKLPNIDTNEHDLTIVMGGSMGVYEAEKFPYLYNEVDYIKKRIAANKPLLGICLGGQLIAKSLGGNVYKGRQGKETGWCEIHMTSEGEGSAIRYLDASHTKMTQGHQDTFDLPDGAVLLAMSNQYKNQIFSYGDKVLGFQCHPELDAGMVQHWLNEKDDFMLTEEMTKEKISNDTEIYAEKLKEQTAKFFNEWLDEVGFKKETKNA